MFSVDAVLLHLRRMEVPGLRSPSELELQPMPQLRRCWILHLLCHLGNSAVDVF